MASTNFALSNEEKDFCLKLLSLFKLDGISADTAVTEGQLLIFGALVLKKSNRIQIITSTQYGKSLIVALACIVLSCIEGELICIPAPTEEKARIIMRYYLQHLGDHPLFYSQLEKGDKVDRLIMESSRDRLVLRNRGGVYILSVHASNSQKGFEAAMGEGAKTVIQDESSLIPDTIESTIFRMIAGKKDAMYVKIGNPFYRNHFYKSSLDERYLQIFIDFKQGLKEGRYDWDFIEEARLKPNFDILYACRFPQDDIINADGYIRLLSDRELETLYNANLELTGALVLGSDPAAGGDNSTLVLKSPLGQQILFNQPIANVMDFVYITVQAARHHNVQAIVTDKTGVGQGYFYRLKEVYMNSDMYLEGIDFAESPKSDLFYNRKAELYWLQRSFLLSGGRMIPNKAWEWEHIRYKNKDGKVLIESKDDLRRRGIKSPNCVDAAVLTQAIDLSTVQRHKLFRNTRGVWKDKTIDIWRGK